MFTWDQELRKYRDSNGRVVSDQRVRSWVDSMTGALALIFIARAENLRQDFNLDLFIQWNQQTRLDLNSLHYAMSLIAFGGRSQMDETKWSIAEGLIGFHLGFWDSFSRNVIAGQVEMDGHFPVRTSLYALAGHSSYINMVTGRERVAGMSEEKRVPTSGNPCVDCKTEAAKGWIPIGTGRAIGDSVCLVRCRCFKEYR